MLVPARAADGDGAGVAEIARRPVAEGHPAIDTLARVLIHDALAGRRITDLAIGAVVIVRRMHARIVNTGIVRAGSVVIAVGVGFASFDKTLERGREFECHTIYGGEH